MTWGYKLWLQLRALACVVIVAFARLLNLAVPILYRDVVNTMADVSARTHPPTGQPVQHFTFKQACHLSLATLAASHMRTLLHPHVSEKFLCLQLISEGFGFQLDFIPLGVGGGFWKG